MASLAPRPPSVANCGTPASGRRRAPDRPALPPRRPRASCRARARAAPPAQSLLGRLASLLPSLQPPSSSAAAAGPLRPTPAAVSAAKRVVALAEATDRGTEVTPEARAELLALTAALREDEAPRCRGSAAAARAAITGTWRQLWSTEKETLFIFTTIAPLFGVRGEEAYQVIDADAGRLQNVITFSNGAAFVVESTLEVVVEGRGEEEEGPEGEQRGPLPLRCNFKFTGATLKLPSGRAIRLPPAGKGWFEVSYVDGRSRVAYDVRKDTLVVARDGPVRWF
jgi:hypothetical protein